MIFHNSKFAARNKLTRLILLVVTGTSIAAISMLDTLDPYSIASTRFSYIGIIILCYTLYNIYKVKQQNIYFYLSDGYGKLTFRFYRLVFFNKKYTAYEIPHKDFFKYEITDGKLIVFQKKQNKIGKYPPINLSCLKEEEVSQIKNILNKFKAV